MGLLDTLMGSLTGKATAPAGAENPLMGALGGLMSGNGGVQGLLDKFTKGGLGDAAASWVGMGENKPVSADQVHHALGADQISAVAAKLGIDTSKASSLLAEFLPKVIDKLTPSGQVDPSVDHHQGLAALLPSLLNSLRGKV